MDIFYIFLFTVFSSLLYIVYRLLMRKPSHWEKQGVPSAPYSVPYVGNLWPVLIQRTSFLELYYEIYKSFPNSSMVGLYNCGKFELLLRDPELVKTVLQTNFSSFQNTGYYLDPELDPLFTQNPAFSNGIKWKSERAVYTHSFSSSKLKNMAVTLSEIGANFSKYLNENIKNNGGTWEVEAQALFSPYNAEVTAGLAFGLDGQCFGKKIPKFQEIGSPIFSSSKFNAFKQFVTILVPSVSKTLKTSLLPRDFDSYCRQLVNDILQTRKQKDLRGNDFVQYVYDWYKTEEEKVCEDIVACYGASLYFNLHLAPNHVDNLISFNLAKNPEVQTKVRTEVKEILRKYEGKLTYEGIQEMKYLDLVIKESMRISPMLSSMPRICSEEFKLVGFDGVECVVKPGTKLIISPMGLHHDSKYWTDPEVFKPERFNENNDDFPKFAYLPFGGGARICPGMRMALLQMKYGIASLVNDYILTLSSRTKLPFTFDPVAFVNLPRGGIWLNIKHL